MQSELVAAEAVSQPNSYCSFCTQPLTGELAPHLCHECGSPQPVTNQISENYFSMFGLKTCFGIDPTHLQTRFYALSRALHPDRFSSSKSTLVEHSKLREASLARMSLINQAYQTLSDADLRREYLIKLLYPEAMQLKPAIPMDLAEEWFEIQESSSDAGLSEAKHFLEKVLNRKAQGQIEILADERKFDQSGDLSVLKLISERSNLQNYLDSLVRNVGLWLNRS